MVSVKGISTFVGVVSVAALLSLNSVTWPGDIHAIRLELYKDTVRKYEIVKKNGNHEESCIYAGYVTSAALETQNEKLYKSAKNAESLECLYAKMDRTLLDTQSEARRARMTYDAVLRSLNK